MPHVPATASGTLVTQMLAELLLGSTHLVHFGASAAPPETETEPTAAAGSAEMTVPESAALSWIVAPR